MSIFLHRHYVILPKFNCLFKKKNLKEIEKAYKMQVRQQHLKHNCTKSQVEIQTVIQFVVYYPRVSRFFPNLIYSGGFRGGSRGSLEPPSGTKLFHFHGEFQYILFEIRQTNFRNPGSAPDIGIIGSFL